MRVKRDFFTVIFGMALVISAQSPDPQPGSMSGITVYGFSQSGTKSAADNQIIVSQPDINIRAWSQWGVEGMRSMDFNAFTFASYRQKNITLIGGLTASVYFMIQADDSATFLDMVTRDASNGLVPHSYIEPAAYRGNIANPKFRNYMINNAKIQIDAGVNGIFFDEVNAGYSGNKFNGNEGFDDYHLKDFNQYLVNKHPDFSKHDWMRVYKMDSINVIDKSKPLDDLDQNFNYRSYLKKNGWQTSPFSNANPLAKVWGTNIANRPDIERTTFIQHYTVDIYWKEIVTAVREYGRKKYNKEILITSNGIFPFTDFNSVGLYNYNNDDNEMEADYVPMTSTKHLKGSVSLSNVFKNLYKRNRAVSGNVPCVLFLDWPTDMMNDYYGLTAREKMDYWRIYAAEAYANGLFFAFHFKTAMANEPTSAQSGVFDSIKNYMNFYKTNRALYEKCFLTDTTISVSKQKISASLISQPSQNRYLVHLVNHDYDNGMNAQVNITISVPLKETLKQVRLFSPDMNKVDEIVPHYVKDSIVCQLDTLRYYTVISLEYGDVAIVRQPAMRNNRHLSAGTPVTDNYVNLQGKKIMINRHNGSGVMPQITPGMYINGADKNMLIRVR
jgi:hypothetical protein